MNKQLALTLLAGVAAIPAVASAEGIVIRRDQVIPVIIDDNISVRNAHPGDRFRAHVDENRDLPFDTRFEGRIAGIRDKRGNEPGMVELVFTDMILPDGSHYDIDAIPIAMSDVNRSRDGRFGAKVDYRKKGNSVLIGAVGGFVVGSIFHKQLEGTILGALAGIAAAETDRNNDGNTVLTRGSKLGALFNRDAQVDFRSDSRRQNPFGRRDDGWRRDDSWRKPRETRPDDRQPDDRWNDGPPQPERTKGGEQPPIPTPPAPVRTEELPPVPRPQEIRIGYEGKQLRFEREQPFRDGEVIMVPLSAVLSPLGLHASEPNADKTLFIDSDEGFARVQIDSKQARLNGRTVDLKAAPAMRDGVLYVPLDLLAEISKDTLTVNGTAIERGSF